MYQCGICGKEHKTIEERNICETECLRQFQIKAEQEKQAKMKAEKQKRCDEIKEAEQHYFDLLKQYQKDYGMYIYQQRTPDSILDNVKGFRILW